MFFDSVTIHRGACDETCGDKGCMSPHTPKPVTVEADSVVCHCDICTSGVPVTMDEWLKTPAHMTIHERIQAAVASDEIKVQGEAL